MHRYLPSWLLMVCLGMAGVALASDAPAQHAVPTSASGDVVVGLCDGKTSVEVPGLKPGQTLPKAKAQAVSDTLMTTWKLKNPGAHWDQETLVAQAASPAPSATSGTNAESGAKAAGAQAHANVQHGDTYGSYGARDEAVWKASTDQFVDHGKKIFHDAKQLGGTVGISCDMCHPNAANTHPETYPKFQVQLGRVALLRDMINWCIENPVKGKPFADGDDRLKALEAYILAQRKGTALDYGKH